MIKTKISLMAIALAAMSSQAFAAQATATFQATATLSSSCVVSATNVNFGSITPAATGTAKATGTITATCSKGVGYGLEISSGSGTITNRTMSGAAADNTDKLAYNLYINENLQDVWGDTTAGYSIGLSGTGQAETTTVYGQLSLNQYLKPDTYTDNLTVTLKY